MDISWSLNQKALWHQATGEYDKYAKPVRKPAVEVSCRFLRKRALVKGSDGKEVVSESQLHVLMEPSMDDCFEYGGRKYYPINIADGLGLYDGKPSFWVVYL